MISDRTKVGKKISPKQFAAHLKKQKRRTLKLKLASLDRLITYPARRRAYDSSKWYLAEVRPSEIGVWSRAGGLPSLWTNGSLAETAKRVQRALEQKGPRALRARARYAIPGILHSSILEIPKEKYLSPIILKGDTGTRGRRSFKRKMSGFTDDGSMRSIALAMSGAKTIRVYIGIPKKEVVRK
ncbi:MAG: hypothetical protein ACREGR_00530 [Minisyncoccia bacterium]